MREMPRLSAVALPFAGTEAWTLAVVFSLLLSAAAMPILATPVAPLADFVNHLARMHVLADIGRDPRLSEYYSVDWAMIPNLTMDILVPRMVKWFGIYTAGQLFLIAVIGLMAAGPMVLHRALWGRWSIWPLVVFPFVYNGIFLFGLVNYLFGVGLAIWGAAAWIALSGRPVYYRVGSAMLLVPCLFFCHLFAAGLYGMTILAIEVARAAENRRLSWRGLAGLVLPVGIPFLPVPFLLLASPTFGLAKENIWESVGKIDGLAMVIQTYADLPDLAVAGAIITATVWLARMGRLRFHAAGWVLATLSVLVYLAMPRMLFGSWIADQRLPVGAVFLLAGFVRFTPGHAAERATLLTVILGASILRFADVALHWRSLDRDLAEIHQSLAHMPPGAKVLVAYADDAGDHMRDTAISHAPCLAVIERDAVVSTLFTVPGKQILGLKGEARGLVDREDGDPPMVSQLLATVDGPVPGQPHYWDAWPGRYDYVYILYTDPDESVNPAPDYLTMQTQGRRFQLYAVHPDASENPQAARSDVLSSEGGSDSDTASHADP